MKILTSFPVERCAPFILFRRGLRHKNKTVEQFRQFLSEDMSYRKIEVFCGRPDKDMGTGIHINVYVLQDSTKIRIGFTDRHVDRDQRLLSILI